MLNNLFMIMARKSFSILLADDEPGIRLLLKRVLAIQGYQIYEAHDGVTALDQFLHLQPDLILLDIAMPNLDGSFTCTLFLPFEGEVSFEKIQTRDDARNFFRKYFPTVTPDIENLTGDFFRNPTSALVTIRCYPWTYWDKVALVGDSAHAIVPFYGQGMNAGFEDITVLTGLMERHGEDWERVFSEYQARRKPNADAIAELSYRNFVEMSSRTADPEFLLQKKIERHFANAYPDKWIPAYSRVTFSDRPYAEALAMGDRQEAIMREVMQMPDLENRWDSPEVTNRILELLDEQPVTAGK